MGVTKHTTTYVKSNPVSSIAIVGLGLGILYLATRNNSTPGTPGSNTFLEKISESVGGGLGQIGSGVASVPGTILISGTKKAVTASEERTSTETFNDQPRSNVSAFLATGSKKGDMFSQPVTYNQFIQAQPLAFRGAAAAGNIITNNEAANYGAFVASETKKTVPNANERFVQLGAGHQALIGLGQAVSVPFGGGGAAGWGASVKKWWTS